MDNSDKLSVKQISRVLQITRPDLAEPLTRRSAVDEINPGRLEIGGRRNTPVRRLQEFDDVPAKQRNVREVGGVGFAGMGIGLYGAQDLVAGEPNPLTEPAGAAEE